MIPKHFWLFLFLLLATSSCDLSSTFESDVDFDEGIWHMDSLATFEFDAPAQTQDVEVKLRNNLDYPFYNLYVKLELLDSTGGMLQDTLVELTIYDQKTGKPKGEGNSIYQINTLGLDAYPFPYAGTYSIRLAQYMRKVELEGILSTGVRIVPEEN